MSAADATISREEQVLGKLAELDLILAEHIHAKALAAGTLDEMNACARSYQRIARSVRQSLLAKAKLAREREAAAKPQQAPPAPPPEYASAELRRMPGEIRARIGEAHVAARSLLEVERPDWDRADDLELYDVLLDMAYQRDFMSAPLETIVTRVLRTLAAVHETPLDPEPDPDRPPAPAPAVQDSA